MKRILILSFLFLSFLDKKAWSQDLADDSIGKRRSAVEFKLGAFYNSYLHYYGRIDSLESRGFFPMAELWFDKKFYITIAPVFVNNAALHSKYAGTVTMAGYRFGKENVSAANIYLVKPFYQKEAQLVQSALQAQLGASGTYLSKVVNLTIGGDLKLSDNLDLGAQAGIDRVFRKQLGAKSVIVFDPSAYVHAGTRRFSRTYYKESSFLLFPGPQQEITEHVSEFKILSYEFSMPIVYGRGKFQLIASPSFVMPQNLLGERGENAFYGLVGAKITF